MTGVFQVILHKAQDLRNQPFAEIDYPLVETPDEWVLHGFSYPNHLKEFGDKARSVVYEKSSLSWCTVIRKRRSLRKASRIAGSSDERSAIWVWACGPSAAR